MQPTRNLLLLALLSFYSCATIVSRSTYPVTIHSEPTKASIEIRDKKDRVVYKGMTPVVVPLKAGAGFFSRASYTVRYKLDGYQEKIVPIHYKINGWYFGNLLIGGVIGMLIVDPATGAMWRIQNDFIDERLDPVGASTSAPQLRIRDINELGPEMRSKLVPINLDEKE